MEVFEGKKARPGEFWAWVARMQKPQQVAVRVNGLRKLYQEELEGLYRQEFVEEAVKWIGDWVKGENPECSDEERDRWVWWRTTAFGEKEVYWVITSILDKVMVEDGVEQLLRMLSGWAPERWGKEGFIS